ncbi:MAG: acylphosphatase [Pirellulaceae bacterium]|nr:acylphosphatase [Pirellulaceae bacterium]
MNKANLDERQTVLFSGRVQGVGFRFTTQSIARDYAITGTVKNLPDGRVELIVEGKQTEIRQFVGMIEQRMKNHISHQQTTTSTPENQFADFSIAR